MVCSKISEYWTTTQGRTAGIKLNVNLCVQIEMNECPGACEKNCVYVRKRNRVYVCVKEVHIQ